MENKRKQQVKKVRTEINKKESCVNTSRMLYVRENKKKRNGTQDKKSGKEKKMEEEKKMKKNG